ncbi:MAG: hypothetical protein ACHQWU_05920 [Gemmatimonadales bacterium]
MNLIALAFAALLLATPLAAQATDAAATQPGALSIGPDKQVGATLSSPAQRRAQFAAADAIVAVLRRDDALVHPIGYSVVLSRAAGQTLLEPGDRRIDGVLPYGVVGGFAYLATSDDGRGGHTFAAEGARVSLGVIVNGIGRLSDAEEQSAMLDGGPPVLTNFRHTGDFRGHPVYNGDCIVVSGRPVPPFVPVTMQRYYRLLILTARADSTRNAADQRRDAAAQASEDARNNSPAARAQNDSNERATYEMMKKIDPAAAEQFRKQMRDLTAQLAAQTKADTGAGSSSAKIADIIRQGTIEAGKHLNDLQAKLDGMSPTERQTPVAVVAHGVAWDLHGDDELIGMDDPDGSPLVQVNPAFFDRTRPATAPQIITLCIQGIQGLEDRSYERYAGDEREQERVRLEQRTRDVVRIRDHLDWAALEAIVKP